MESYLKVTGEELKKYERQYDSLPPEEENMIRTAPWSSFGRENYNKGKQEGKQEGRKALIKRLIKRRFGDAPEQTTERLNQLSA